MAAGEAGVQEGRRMGLATAAIGTVIGGVALYVVIAHLGCRSLPFVTDDRTAFVLLAIIGLVMCAFGIQTILNSTGLLSPGTFIGAGIGILLLIAFVLALLNRPMFLLSSCRSGFVTLAVLMLVKWIVATGSLIYAIVAK